MARAKPELRVMVDANILIAGSVWPRWPFEVLQHALRGDFCLVLTSYIIGQAQRRIEKRFPDYMDQFASFLDGIEFELVPDPSKEEIADHKNLVRDITDVPIVLAAMYGNVDYLVSEDKDLTASDDTTDELRKHLTVLISGTFLREVMDWASEELEMVRNRSWRDLESSE